MRRASRGCIAFPGSLRRLAAGRARPASGWTAPACERIADGVAHASLGACYRTLMAEGLRAVTRAPARDGWGRTRRWEVVDKGCLATPATAVAAVD